MHFRKKNPLLEFCVRKLTKEREAISKCLSGETTVSCGRIAINGSFQIRVSFFKLKFSFFSLSLSFSPFETLKVDLTQNSCDISTLIEFMGSISSARIGSFWGKQYNHKDNKSNTLFSNTRSFNNIFGKHWLKNLLTLLSVIMIPFQCSCIIFVFLRTVYQHLKVSNLRAINNKSWNLRRRRREREGGINQMTSLYKSNVLKREPKHVFCGFLGRSKETFLFIFLKKPIFFRPQKTNVKFYQ